MVSTGLGRRGREGAAFAMLWDTAKILLVEDDEDHAELIRCGFASRAEFAPLTRARNLREARSRLAESIPDLVIADLRLPDGSGMELLPKEKDHARFPVVIMTAQGDEAAAVEAMKAGALDYIGQVAGDGPRHALRG